MTDLSDLASFLESSRMWLANAELHAKDGVSLKAARLKLVEHGLTLGLKARDLNQMLPIMAMVQAKADEVDGDPGRVTGGDEGDDILDIPAALRRT